ncbi:hypothetical protein QJQ45_028191, partial [Haematococcus lacustris]
ERRIGGRKHFRAEQPLLPLDWATREYILGVGNVVPYSSLEATLRCSSVDHHQPEQPVSLPGAPQPQFDIEAELARVAQFQEQFRELDQALTALQPLPGPPAQPTSTPMRLFNRFAVLDLEYGVPKEQEVLEVQ